MNPLKALNILKSSYSNYFLIIPVLLLFSGISLVNAQEKSSIKFSSSSWNEVVKTAKEKKTAIFLFAATPSCRYCRQMEIEIFTKKEVADFYNSNFISYKINIDDGAEGELLAKRYGIVGFPTYMYFDKNGELLHQSGSAKPASEFILDGKNAFNPQKALFPLKSRYINGERTPMLLFHYSNALSSYLHSESPEEKIVSEYLLTQTAQQLGSEDNLRFIFTKHLSFHSPATQYFLQNQAKFSSLFSDDEIKKKEEKIITRTASIAGQENNLRLFEELNQAIVSYSKETTKLSMLARIHFYGGQKNWLAYAKETLAYSKSHVGNDWQTLHETATYLRYFSDDKEALRLGALIMEKATTLNKSYDNLLLYAQLKQKSGDTACALKAAREAYQLAELEGKDKSEATSLITALEK